MRHKLTLMNGVIGMFSLSLVTTEMFDIANPAKYHTRNACPGWR